MNRVIYALSRLPDWICVANHLRNKLGWEPCYWLIPSDLEQKIASNFPNSIVHNVLDAHKGIPAPGMATHQQGFLDQAILQRFKSYEANAIGMMDRMDAENSFGYGERVRLYYHQLIYWRSIIALVKPDVVIFTETPHTLPQYILYAVAREQAIHTLMFTHTGLANLTYVRSSIEETPRTLEQAYERALGRSNVHLPPHLEAAIQTLSGDYTLAKPWYVTALDPPSKSLPMRLLDRLNQSFFVSNFLSLQFVVAYLADKIRRNRTRPQRSIPLKLKDLPVEYSDTSSLSLRISNLRGLRHKQKLLSRYTTLAQHPDMTRPYVYFPLHYQPERTTLPEGGVYHDQFLVLSVLSAALPSHWRIYVKEHPAQFAANRSGHLGRLLRTYGDILAYPNIDLVSLETSSFDLIDNARAVATVTGTAGWEALVRGKPVLLFGNSWYRTCNGVLEVRDFLSCQDAISVIQNGYMPTSHDIKAFAFALQEIGLPVYLNPSTQKNSNSTPTQNTLFLSELIVRHAQSDIAITGSTGYGPQC